MPIVIDPLAALTLGQAVGNIISGLVDAQAAAARTTVDFIDEVGFLPPSSPDAAPALRTVSFGYRKRDENGEVAAFEVDLPLLGMVDIPLIAVRRATIDLEFEVSGVEERPAPPPLARPVLAGIERPVLKGSILTGRRPASDQRGTIKISVEVEKADLPPALARALDILEVAAHETKADP